MKFFLAIFFLFTGFSSLLGQEADFILKGEASEPQLPLGFMAFQPRPGETKPLPLDPGRVIADDLEFSGRVKIFEVLKTDSTSLKYLLMNEAYAYIWGEYQFSGSNIILKCYLKDIETGDLILGKKYEGKIKQLRQMAHKFSDELVYQLFGEKGIAQTRIAFLSSRSGKKEVYVMDYDGADVRQITRNSTLHLTPCWLKGNETLMYTSYKGGSPQLYTHNLSSNAVKIFLQSKYMNTGPDYNFVDGEIVYTSSVKGNTEIFRVDEEGKKPTRLTYANSLEASPSWSPNGYEIVFTSSRSGNPMLYIMDRDGSNTRRLTYEGKYNTSPAWSPAGDKIAFCGMNERGEMDIFTISPTGKDLRRLTFATGSNESPDWSPDGRAIVFSSTRLGRKELYIMRADGTNQKQLTTFGGNSSPSWSHF